MQKLLSLIALLTLASCISAAPVKPVKQKTGFDLQQVSFSELKGFDNEKNIQVAAYRFKEVCKQLYNHPKKFASVFTKNKNIWFEKCSKLSATNNYKRFIEQNFNAYSVKYNGNEKGLFTGYFEKQIKGSLKKTAKYKYPIYKKPSNPELLKLTREQINDGALKGKGLEIAYTDSLPDLFMLQVQGSGELLTPQGKKYKILFNGKNKHKYASLGKYFGEKNLLPSDKINSTSITNYLKSHPETAEDIMNVNDSYIFFKLSSSGPYGSLGTSLKPFVSIAVDRNFIPLGSLLWLETTLPDNKNMNSLAIAEDTGSAIKGAVRADVFFGAGKRAEYLASNMVRRNSRYYLLLPKEIDYNSYFGM